MITSCHGCSAKKVKEHCANPACHWRTCEKCHGITAIAYGELLFKPRPWIK